MTARKQKIGNVPLLALLAVTILINIPFLSGRLLFVLDTLQKFTSFHFIYSHLFFHDELPRWIPLINYGVPSDLQLFFMLPTDLAVMFVGWMLGIRDALFLFKVGMILAQMLFIYGFYLLCRRLFRSTLTVVLVCLARSSPTPGFTSMASRSPRSTCSRSCCTCYYDSSRRRIRLICGWRPRSKPIRCWE